jgi:hypothetical protein
MDSLGGGHFCWIGSASSQFNPRYRCYRFLSENGDSIPAVQLGGGTQSGFGGIDLYNGAVNHSFRDIAVLGYHDASGLNDIFAFDSGRGAGSFSYDISGFPEGAGVCLWPSISIDINDNIQAVATQSNVETGQLRQHIYSRRPFGSQNWTSPIVIDTTYADSPIITSSPVSSKSAIVWTSPIFQDSNQYDNDLFYLQSIDGVNWNIPGGRTNLTNYAPSAQGDTTLRAFCDVDAIYDFDDNLHLIWNAAYVTRDSADEMVVLYRSALFHWSAASGIDLVYDHPIREWPCDMGAWNLSLSKMSIGVDADSNFVYVVFTRFDPSDYADFDTVYADPNPCGGDNAMPCANGELYMTWSTDGGGNWATPADITNSQSPNCLAGNCDNDNWSSLAEEVDDYLHILYIDDKDAGSAVFSEGDPTENPVLYMAVRNPTRFLGGCSYIPGDINDNGQANGVDVSYGVNYFKGFGSPPPVVCQDCPEPGQALYGAGDVNSNCQFNGVDITYFVNFLKGVGPALSFCQDCPPSGR